MMDIYYSIYDLPPEPAVYCMYGARGRTSDPAYVGQTKDLQDRIDQHFRRRISSVVSGTFAAQIIPDYVKEIEWWSCEEFVDERKRRIAEEIISEVKKPRLRSGTKSQNMQADEAFRTEIKELIKKPTGKLVLPNLNYLLDKVLKLEERVKELESMQI